MTTIPGTNVASRIVPFDTNDKFATHLDKYGRGGYRIVADVTERDSITEQRQKEGMLVYVKSSEKTYRLKSTSATLSAGNWGLTDTIFSDLQSSYDLGNVINLSGGDFIINRADSNDVQLNTNLIINGDYKIQNTNDQENLTLQGGTTGSSIKLVGGDKPAPEVSDYIHYMSSLHIFTDENLNTVSVIDTSGFKMNGDYKISNVNDKQLLILQGGTTGSSILLVGGDMPLPGISNYANYVSNKHKFDDLSHNNIANIDSDGLSVKSGYDLFLDSIANTGNEILTISADGQVQNSGLTIADISGSGGSGSDADVIGGTNINVSESPTDTFTVNLDDSISVDDITIGTMTLSDISPGLILTSDVSGLCDLKFASTSGPHGRIRTSVGTFYFQDNTDSNLATLSSSGFDLAGGLDLSLSSTGTLETDTIDSVSAGGISVSDDLFLDSIANTGDEILTIAADGEVQNSGLTIADISGGGGGSDAVLIGDDGIQVVESPTDTWTISISGDYATNSIVENISGNLQTQIDNISGGTQVTVDGIDVNTLELSGGINSSLIPSVSGTYDIGSDDKSWRAGYFDEDELYTGNKPVATQLDLYNLDVSLQLQISNIIGGQTELISGQRSYTLSNENIKSNANPIVTIQVPTTASGMPSAVVTNVVSGGFDVILSSSPDTSGYKLNWMTFGEL